MLDMTKPILCIVPERTYALHARIIKTTLWAVDEKFSYVAMDAETFVETYGSTPADEAAAQLRERFSGVLMFGTLSKRERLAYDAAMNPILLHIGELNRRSAETMLTLPDRPAEEE